MIGDFLHDVGTDHGPASETPAHPAAGDDGLLGEKSTVVHPDTPADPPTASDLLVSTGGAEGIGSGAPQGGVGDPSADAAHWHYQGPKSACAVVSQGSIIEALTGVPFDQDATTSWLQQQGWYDPATGTRPEDLHRLFDAYGIPNASGSTDLAGLWDALASGDKVMVTLDANEIWTPLNDPATGAPVEQIQPAGHAVWLTGLHQDASGKWQVVLNDSGSSCGRAETVNLADFVNAWADFGNHAVVAGGHTTGTMPSEVRV